MALIIFPNWTKTKATLPPKDFTDAILSLRAEGYIQTLPFTWKDFASSFNDLYKSVADYKRDLITAGIFRKPVIAGTDVIDYTFSTDKVATQTALGLWPPQPGSKGGFAVPSNNHLIALAAMAVAVYWVSKKWK